MFAKFLLTVAVVALVWFGFRHLQRLSERGRRSGPPPRRDGARFTPAADGESVRDLVKCPVCSTWRPARQGACGRSDCPNQEA